MQLWSSRVWSALFGLISCRLSLGFRRVRRPPETALADVRPCPPHRLLSRPNRKPLLHILEPCTHSVQLEGLCALCGKDLTTYVCSL